MNQIIRTINRFHNDFFSYKDVITYKSFWVWGFVASFCSFCYFSFRFLSFDDGFLFKDNFSIIFSIIFEVISLFFWFRLQTIRDHLVVRRCQINLDTEIDKIVDLKKLWLSKTLGLDATNYIDLAEKIDKLFLLRDKHKSVLALSKNKIYDFIFTADSKNRVVAMFIATAAATIALCAANGSNINDVFMFFEGISLFKILIINILVSFYIFLGFIIVRYAFLVISICFESVFGMGSGLNVVRERRVSGFINELLYFAEFEKARIKVQSNLKFNKHLNK